MWPAAVCDLARLLLKQIAGLTEKIIGLDAELRRRAEFCNNAKCMEFGGKFCNVSHSRFIKG